MKSDASANRYWWTDLQGYDFTAHILTFACGDLAFVYDVNSNSLHRLDRPAQQIVEALIDNRGDVNAATSQLLCEYQLSSELIEEIFAELGELKKAGLLFTKDDLARRYSYQGSELAKVERIDTEEEIVSEAYKPIVKALCMHIAHDCNLRCTYCFAGTGPFGGDRSLMSLETGQEAIEFLLRHSQGRRHIEIDFFGGEPLLNFAVVKDLVAYAKKRAAEEEKVLKLTLTTNGLLLDDETTRFLNEEGLSVVLSLDGRPNVHDAMRPYIDGQGSYEEVVENLQKFAQSRQNQDYYVRGTYTRHNPDFAADALHIHDLGFVHLSVEPVVASPQDGYALTMEDLPQIDEQYRILAEEIHRRKQKGEELNFFHFQLDLAEGPCLAKRLSGCGAGFEYMAVDPKGDLYPCHQFVGQEKFKLGHVSGTIEGQSQEVCRVFADAHIYHKQGCPSCWARFLCSGGCHANNEAESGDLRIPSKIGCELARIRLKWALYAKVLMEAEAQ
ncbi:thioether cross-link-forming SCIFF peptide maturase [Heliorestis acidaminivorans]|uniref:Thioether cross-link-forming SCIFF peptide maturase n=2 Tax=Heliorestis acidaminivorans TaxID=553427 RepID=A0A6I0F5K9_9FIRM|nr:thioether cross-link-forming SCIFF peptide maturase [Heliorestis acidaminivorans]